jgi:hypothetical protein
MLEILIILELLDTACDWEITDNNCGIFLIYCLVLHEMLPVGHQNVKSAEKAREILCFSL